MKKTVNVSAAVILLLAIAVVTMSFGFAQFSQNLTISGTATIEATEWNIHYDTDSLNEISTIKASTKTLSETDYAFEVTLTEPGDSYEVEFDVVNDGDFGAVLDKIEMSTLTDAQKKYVSYTLTYGNKSYTATTSTGLGIGLASGASETVKVKVEYLMPESSSDLPGTNDPITISGKLLYLQAS